MQEQLPRHEQHEAFSLEINKVVGWATALSLPTHQSGKCWITL